jgi:hypothetical protein
MCKTNACCPDVSAVGDLVTDEICGNFHIPCVESDSKSPVRIWEIDPTVYLYNAQSSASISIYYDQGCSDEISAMITKKDGSTVTISVAKLNTRSYTAIEIVSLDLICDKKEHTQTIACRGKYCINLHYDVIKA